MNAIRMRGSNWSPKPADQDLRSIREINTVWATFNDGRNVMIVGYSLKKSANSETKAASWEFSPPARYKPFVVVPRWAQTAILVQSDGQVVRSSIDITKYPIRGWRTALVHQPRRMRRN